MELYDLSTFSCSKVITNLYSTSFSLGIKMLDKKYHMPIYAVYGFVRYADEIVDTFHGHDKQVLLDEFKSETYKSIAQGISLNPVLHSFQKIVNEYKIEHELIDAFLHSMEMDLYKSDYTWQKYTEYIYGSAEVVGLMCLRIFCEGDENKYQDLKPGAKSLGAAFQKVNFLRDMKSDFDERGRVYFPGVNFTFFNNEAKKQIEDNIKQDFDDAYLAIIRLPKGARLGVYLAYIYYQALFKKIKKLSPSTIVTQRVRVPDNIKILLLIQSYFKFRFKAI
jgi:phytoene/squalene synthetase